MASIARDTRPHETTRAFAEIVAVVDEHILGKVHLWLPIRVHWLIFSRGKQTDDTNVWGRRKKSWWIYSSGRTISQRFISIALVIFCLHDPRILELWKIFGRKKREKPFLSKWLFWLGFNHVIHALPPEELVARMSKPLWNSLESQKVTLLPTGPYRYLRPSKAFQFSPRKFLGLESDIISVGERDWTANQ